MKTKLLAIALILFAFVSCEKPIIVPSADDDVRSDTIIIRDHVSSTLDGKDGNCVNCHY